MSELSSQLRAKSLRMLAKREHSRFELKRKLSGTGAEDEYELIDSLLDDLEQRGWLSDERYVEQQLRYRISKGQGPIRIKHELASSQVAESLIESALATAEVDWFEHAREVRRKRFGSAPPADAREKAKQWRFLAYRGFPSEVLSDLLKATD